MLALATVGGAAACVDEGIKPTGVVQAPDSADQVLVTFQTYLTRDGVRRARIDADTAFVYEGTASVQLRKMKMTFFDERGAETSTLTANRGTYFWQNGLVLAEGTAELRSPDGRSLKSEKLRIDEQAKEISTDQPFTLDTRGDHLAGTSLRTDPEFKNVVAGKPRGTKGTGVALPGQD